MLKPWAVVIVAFVALAMAPNARCAERDGPLAEERPSYTLANGHVTAKVDKRSGDLVSLKFRGLELLSGGSGHPFGYWSHTPGRGIRAITAVTIDPAANGGERGEVSVKG